MGATQAIKDFWRDFPTWLPDGCQPDAHHRVPVIFARTRGTRGGPTRPGWRRRNRETAARHTEFAFGSSACGTRLALWISGPGSGGFLGPVHLSLPFPDTYLSSIVDHACHALSIDDERQTLLRHPLGGPPTADAGPGRAAARRSADRTSLVCGVHANVGGGYPKHGLALVALDWMMAKAQEHGLHFLASDQQYVAEHADAHDKLYNSRAGRGRLLPLPAARHPGALRGGRHRRTDHSCQRSTPHPARTDEYGRQIFPHGMRRSARRRSPGDRRCQRVRHLDMVQDVVWWRASSIFSWSGVPRSGGVLLVVQDRGHDARYRELEPGFAGSIHPPRFIA